MTWLVLWLHVLAMAAWLGETIFFGAVAAPALFAGMGRQEAGDAVALILPRYYVVGHVCGAVLIVSALWLWRRSAPGTGGTWLAAAIVAGGMLAAGLAAGVYVLPQADALRLLLHDPDTAGAAQPRFDALHALSVRLNAAVLAGNLVLSGLLAARVSRGVETGRRLSRFGGERIR